MCANKLSECSCWFLVNIALGAGMSRRPGCPLTATYSPLCAVLNYISSINVFILLFVLNNSQQQITEGVVFNSTLSVKIDALFDTYVNTYLYVVFYSVYVYLNLFFICICLLSYICMYVPQSSWKPQQILFVHLIKHILFLSVFSF